MPAVTHCRDTDSALPSAPAITMPPTPGVKPATPSRLRLRTPQSRRFSGEAESRVSPLVSWIATRRSGFGERQRAQQRRVHEREDRAVGADAERQRRHRDRGERGRLAQLAEREGHVVAQLLEPGGDLHVAVPLPAELPELALHAADVSHPLLRLPPRRLRIDPARDQLARPQLEVQRDLLVDLLVDRHAPEPRAQRALHDANSTFETPVEKRRQAAVSAASRSRPGGGDAVELRAPAELGRAPFGLDQALPLEAVERRIERAVLDDHGVAGGVLQEARDRVAVARAADERLQDEGVERSVEQGVRCLRRVSALMGRYLDRRGNRPEGCLPVAKNPGRDILAVGARPGRPGLWRNLRGIVGVSLVTRAGRARSEEEPR